MIAFDTETTGVDFHHGAAPSSSKKGDSMISLDTETTGVDLLHGALPFFVTTCDEHGRLRFWEWDVNPETRAVTIPEDEAREIRQYVAIQHQGVVLHNSRFDAAALRAADILDWGGYWKEGLTEDTMVAGHLLDSASRHDLTSMAMQWLGVDITAHEKALEAAVKECRDICRKRFHNWFIAEEGKKEMPSAAGQAWRFDYWMPRAMASHLSYGPDHPWWTVLAEYANTDSAITLALWQVLKAELERRSLWAIYRESMRLPSILSGMKRRGLTMSAGRLAEQTVKLRQKAVDCEDSILALAAEQGVHIELPKGGRNGFLDAFAFEVLKLPVVKRTAKTCKPSLDADSIRLWRQTLEAGPGLEFAEQLGDRRAAMTALTYMDGYQRFWLPRDPLDPDGDTKVLHPDIHQTGTRHLRASCSNPNGQNVSKGGRSGDEQFSLRSLFGPAPDRLWVSMDFSNIELRVPAYASGEEDLIALFERPDDPPYYGSEHLLNFSVVFPDEWKRELVWQMKDRGHIKRKYKSTLYQWTKNGDFALGYQAGRTTVDQTFRKVGAYDALKTRFAKKEQLNQRCLEQARRLGYVETLPDRTVDSEHGYPIIIGRYEDGAIRRTTALAYMSSGTACWIKRRAMVKCQEYLDAWNRSWNPHVDGEEDDEMRDVFMVLEVHDELLFDFPAAMPGLKMVVEHLRQLMESCGPDVGVPTPVGVEYHSEHWGKADRDGVKEVAHA
jgi:DNA polymerase I-like protein with 3'-5' exonuclease and polymerase domains